MNPQAQRIALAEFCGWRYQEACSQSGDVDFWFKQDTPSAWSVWDLPDYLNDLNAMHEAEKLVDTDVYREVLATVYGRATARYDFERATATQRAEALLKTIGKWGVTP